jgi:predicted membrane protein
MWEIITEVFNTPAYMLTTSDRFILCFSILFVLIGIPIIIGFLVWSLFSFIKYIKKKIKRRNDK